MAQYTDEFASVRAKMYALNKAHIINTSDEADVPYVGTSGEPMPSRPVTTLTPAAFSFSGMSIGSNNKHSILGLKGGAKRTVNVMMDDETPSFYSNNQTGGFADKAVEDELMGGSHCGCGGAQFRARTDTGLLPRGFINKTSIKSGGFEAINHLVPNYRNSGSNLNAIGEAATLGYGHEGISSSSTNSAMNVMILQDPYDKSVPAYNPTRIFSPTAAYDMTASDFKGVHGGAKSMIGLPFKMPTMETLPVTPPSEAEMEGEGSKYHTMPNGERMLNSAHGGDYGYGYDMTGGRRTTDDEDANHAAQRQRNEERSREQLERDQDEEFVRARELQMRDNAAEAVAHQEILRISSDLRSRFPNPIAMANATILSELTYVHNLSDRDILSQYRARTRDSGSGVPVGAGTVPVGAGTVPVGAAKPMPDSEPENDEDLKKALRGMGLPAQ